MVDVRQHLDTQGQVRPIRVGLDIGSTTVKAVVLDRSDVLKSALFSDYRRHHANVRATVAELLTDIHQELVRQHRGDEPVLLSITGSGVRPCRAKTCSMCCRPMLPCSRSSSGPAAASSRRSR